jgi:hypothetical protein
MRRARRTLLFAAAIAGSIALVVGCSSSTSKQASSTTANQLQVQLIASRRAATELLDACLHNDTPHLLPHVETHLRSAQWTGGCKALRDHHMKLVFARADVRGNTATVHVRLRTHDKRPRDFDETWHLSYHGPDGWQLATMPALMSGAWDQHGGNTVTTVHHDDHQTGTSTTGHHDDHQGGTTATTIHHDEHQTGTSTTIHHTETGTSTTIHHTETDH